MDDGVVVRKRERENERMRLTFVPVQTVSLSLLLRTLALDPSLAVKMGPTVLFLPPFINPQVRAVLNLKEDCAPSYERERERKQEESDDNFPAVINGRLR